MLLRQAKSRVVAGFQSAGSSHKKCLTMLSCPADPRLFPARKPHVLVGCPINLNPALDFSHSNPAFCHPKIVGYFCMHITHLISRDSVKGAAEKLRSARLMDAATGAAISGLAAVVATMVAEAHPWKDIVPLVFTAVLLVIAVVFGVRAGVIGTVLAALVFAAFLLSPTGSISVASDAARSNLGWMLLIGLAFSFLFAPPTSGLRRH